MQCLFHVSEQPGIEVFEPRPPPVSDAGIPSPVVWAVDESHLANYLVPRDCPRVAFRRAVTTSPQDRDRFFGTGGGAPYVVAIDAAWFERAVASVLWVYEFSSDPFVCADANAGYFVASTAVTPIGCRQVDNPLAELVTRGAELRVVHDLTGLAAIVAASSLAFSCIRMRNAAPR